jgi:membrane protein YdbS with pleckstrin-like domain
LEAPVALHRALFRKHRREETVKLAHRLAIAGIVFLAFAIVAVTVLIFEVLLGWAGGIAAGALAFLVLVVLWLITPWRMRVRQPPLSENT